MPMAALVLGVVFTANSAPAAPVLQMQISATNSTTQTIPPGGPVPGPLVVTTTIGPFFSLVPVSGSTLGSTATNFTLDLSGTISYTATGAASGNQVLTVDLSATNVTQPVVPALLTMTSRLIATPVGGVVPGTVDLTAWVNSSNTSFSPSGPPNTDTGPQSIPTNATATPSSGTVAGTGGNYAVDVRLVWTVPSGTPGGTYSFNLDGSENLTGAIPEPSTLVLALTALPPLGIGLWFRRRRKQS
jgi:hypothetical protein